MTEMPNIESAEAIDDVLERFRGGKSVAKPDLHKQYIDDMPRYYRIENDLNTLDGDGMIQIHSNRNGNYYCATTKGLGVISDIKNRGYTAQYKKAYERESFLREIAKAQSVTTTPSKKDINKGIAWYSKPLFTQFIWPLLVALAAGYFIFVFKWNR